MRQENPLLTDQVLHELLGRLSNTATRIDPVPTRFSFSRDSKDEPYLNLAIAAGAQYLVTRDKDLLDLMTEAAEGIDFRARFPDLKKSWTPWTSSAKYPSPKEPTNNAIKKTIRGNP